MDRIRLCLCISLAISCLVQVAMLVPIVVDVDFDFDTDPSLKFTDDWDVLEPKDTKDMYDLPILPIRDRRNIAQLMAGANQHVPNVTAVVKEYLNRVQQSRFQRQNAPRVVSE